MRSNILPLKKKEDKHISLSVVKLFFCCCCFFHSVVETLWVCDFVPAGGGWGLPSVPSFCAMLLHSDSCTTWAVAGGRLKSWKSWWCFKSSHIMSVHRNSRKRWGKKKKTTNAHICESYVSPNLLYQLCLGVLWHIGHAMKTVSPPSSTFFAPWRRCVVQTSTETMWCFFNGSK